MALGLTPGGDLSRANGKFQLIDELNHDESIAQRIAIRLRRWHGEWSFDTRLGVDWEALLTKGTATSVLRAAIIREVSLVPGVRGVPELSVVPGANRTMSVSGRVTVAGSSETVSFSSTVGV